MWYEFYLPFSFQYEKTLISLNLFMPKVTVDSVGVDEMSVLHLGSDEPVFPSAHQIRVFDTKTIRPEGESAVGVFPKKPFVPAFKPSKCYSQVIPTALFAKCALNMDFLSSGAKLYPDSQKIFVGNVPPECSNDDIKQAFSKYGQVVDYFPIE